MAAWVRQGQTERIVYRPLRPELLPREIDALIDRNGMATVMNAQAPAFLITVLNDPVVGIPSSSQLSDIGGDLVDVAERHGDDRVSRGLQRFVDQDGDFVTLEVL